MTRSQKNMGLADECVKEVCQTNSEETRRIYGGLCHSFPVMVRTCGLCQTLAFHAAKAEGNGDRARAHDLLVQHAAKIMRIAEADDGDPEPIVGSLQKMNTTAYMASTRTVLDAWIFFKRFAVSVLKVKSAQEAQEDGNGRD